MARSTASPIKARRPAGRRGAMEFARKHGRPLIFGLAAAAFCTGAALAQGGPLSERIQTCGACHGEDGNSRMENIPSIAGQPAFFIVNQLILMRERVRPVEAMEPFVKDLKDEEATALANHFAKLPPKSSDGKNRSRAGQTRRRALRCAALRLLPFADARGSGANPAHWQAAGGLSGQVLEGVPRRHAAGRRHQHERSGRWPFRRRPYGAGALCGFPVALCSCSSRVVPSSQARQGCYGRPYTRLNWARS